MSSITKQRTAEGSDAPCRRVGFDLTSVADVRETLAGPVADRYLQRVFTPEERRCAAPAGLAACFAVKEATIKLLRPRGTDPIAWSDMNVRHHGAGAVTVALKGTAAVLARREGVGLVAGRVTSAGTDQVAAVLTAAVT